MPTLSNYGPVSLYCQSQKIPLPRDPIASYFPKIQNAPHPFCFDSADVSPIYGRFSLIGWEPILQITGKNEHFAIRVLQPRGQKFLANFSAADFPKAQKLRQTATQITGQIFSHSQLVNESQRLHQATSADSLRVFLAKFATTQKTFCGLYGAFAYDFVRLFEKLPELNPANKVPDFNFFLYDNFLHFDKLKKTGHLICLRTTKQALQRDLQQHQKLFFSTPKSSSKISISSKTNFQIQRARFDLGQKEFERLVQIARDLARQGELFEVVFSRTLQASFRGDPWALFLRYRELNPAPYLFFFNFGQAEFLIGASPEMLLRVEKGLVHTRPISGTIVRGGNPIEDHENELKLLQSPKERAELDMLIDLGRNDLARICEPGVQLTEYRTVEKYSRVLHTIAHVQGKLAQGFSALDAVIAILPVGTLAGAPKIAALKMIEKYEKTRRGYYGGGIGYFALSGECDTGIMIRTAHVRKAKLELRVGATLLYDSVPTAEFQETEAKAKAFLDLCS